MFKNADRIPMSPAPETPCPNVVRPWGLRRMAPYKNTGVVGPVATRIDPISQVGAAGDGELIDAKHKRSNTGTEKPTSTNRGDGKDAGEDTDHSQDSDQD
ncbi:MULTISPECIES: putative ATP-grasp-modified RiPP [Actinomadura]|uniref:ATP-grasp-modified RiPP n=1 Tax=Actinomadura yumaensis TaxID=111807 RepID=A0ABW2D1Q4_9ACTN|nr:putative ATP-grasp-modified RiPP [Actinomadura sp. J1-007]MWK34191.1 putative ATP-grasp-modified RiPP [Actinomadura sp. J1-007]